VLPSHLTHYFWNAEGSRTLVRRFDPISVLPAEDRDDGSSVGLSEGSKMRTWSPPSGRTQLLYRSGLDRRDGLERIQS
jgi:hypothetical protein